MLGARAGRAVGVGLLVAPLVALAVSLVVVPLGYLVHQSVLDEATAGLTLAHYQDVVMVARYRHALLWSLELSFAVAIASTLLCLGPAWLLARHRFAAKRIVRSVLTLPMTFAGMIVGFLVVILLGRAGFIPQILERLTGSPLLSGAAYQFPGLIVAYLYFEIPRATLTLESSLCKLDARLEVAARSLGAKGWQTLCWVVLPTIRPALLSTFSVTFAVSIGSFGVLLVLSLRRFTLLPLEIFTQFIAPPPDRGAAAAMSLVLLAIAFAVGYGVRRLADPPKVSHA
jgi:putative spermidine/putrescine transport system permease protein